MSGVQLRVGGATDVGRLRSANEDAILIGATDTVSVVADGMGGHAAGEVASRITIDTLAEVGEVVRVLDLVTAVQAANDRVFEHADANPETTGLGTTVVALALVHEDEEDRIAIVNVGDSRAYRFSGGALDQITDDHSLVGQLVRDGTITSDEARTHPRKNIVTRAIGIEPYVDVDEFQILPRRGDRYLLCSDGLTDEVTDGDIAAVLHAFDDPDEAAAELVRQANERGGRDNISVVVVDVLDDGVDDATRAARAAGVIRSSVPDDPAFSHDPEQDTANVDPVRLGLGGAGSAPPAMAGRGRTVTLRSLGFVALVIAILGIGATLVWNYARNSYFVALDDADQVVIMQGRPGGVLWLDPTFVEDYPLHADDLNPADQERLRDGVVQDDLDDAKLFILQLPTTTTTTSTTTTTTSTSTTSSSTTTSTTTQAAGGP